MILKSISSWPTRARDYAVYLAVRLIVCVLQSWSLAACVDLANWLAWLCHDLFHIRRRVLVENLRTAFPHWSDEQRAICARRMWAHLILMLAEIAHARRKIHLTNWRDYLDFADMAGLMRLLWQDRPKVLISAHYGNFELAAYTFGLFGFETYAVARKLDNPYLHEYLNSFRSAKGQHLLPKDGSAPEIAQLLERRATLLLLADQNAGPKGCWVDFFGKPASTHKAIALFVLANQAPLGVSCGRRIGPPLHYEMSLLATYDPATAELSTQELTQWFTSELESMIRVEPSQYWWLHNRWKGEPPRRRSKSITN
ncbi:MAG: lysophospholipid acyltransferase family protein [Pirellulales bacterium]|nr:lysophospholipid acyltransferase family protein [Pirellulales bacterium]